MKDCAEILKKLLLNGKLKNALEKGLDCFPLNNEIALLFSGFKIAEKEYLQGLQSQESYSTTIAKISKRYWQLIQQHEKEQHSKTSEEKVKSLNRNSRIFEYKMLINERSHLNQEIQNCEEELLALRKDLLLISDSENQVIMERRIGTKQKKLNEIIQKMKLIEEELNNKFHDEND